MELPHFRFLRGCEVSFFNITSIRPDYLSAMNQEFSFRLICILTLIASGCQREAPPAFDSIDYTKLNTSCECIEAATLVYEHTSDLVLDIKRISDETRRRTNLGQPTSEALLDSMLMLSEALRADLEGPGRLLTDACDDFVSLDAVGKGEEQADCPGLKAYRAAWSRLDGIKSRVAPQPQGAQHPVSKQPSPTSPFPVGGFEGELTHHLAYSLEFHEPLRIAEWVAYDVTRREIMQSHVERTNDFREDPLLGQNSPEDDDYKGSGYDRGHLAPAADMAYSADAMSESFYMSNMTPQHKGLNRGRWKSLETQVRKWAIERDSLWVVSGPVLRDGLASLPSGIAIPEYFYKAIYDPEPVPAAIGYLFPNEKCSQPLEAYAVSLDELEALTGMDLFPGLEERLEQTVALSEW
jgi:endonuclease G